MATSVIMPKLEMSQETATVIEWLVEEGQAVDKGAALLEVETDKITVEVESPASGLLAGICVQSGEVVPVTSVIAYILEPGEQLPTANEGPMGSPAAERNINVTPVAARLAEAQGVDMAAVTGTGAGGRITKADVESAVARAQPSGTGVTEEPRPRATPAARRTARETGVNLAGVGGTGPRDRIQVSDVAAVAAMAGRPPIDRQPASVVPLEGMRLRIAQRLTESYQNTPHVTFTVDVDMTAALMARQSLNRRAEVQERPRISVTALLVQVCAWALKRHPRLNASLQGQEIHLHSKVNVGVAVALDEGLIVPVIQQADQLSVSEISLKLADLTERARSGQLLPDDVAAGTFTISNLGMFRIDHFTAIINPPQCAILAVGRISKRPVVEEGQGDDQLVIRPVMTMTLSVDHRLVDGAAAARFLTDLVDALEAPVLML
ncbi:MAG: dihydrolipoamide acetyltransferase family protein [Chloroflexota bacterium]|nr:dihydrolipoamide acetyltransferase family protein [Chloroflexota bacterium]